MTIETQRARIQQQYHCTDVVKGSKGVWNVTLHDKVTGQTVAVFYGMGGEAAMELAHTFVLAKNLHEKLRECVADNQELREQMKLTAEPADVAVPEIAEDVEEPAPSPQPLDVTVTGGAARLLKVQDIPAEEVGDALGKKHLTLHDVQTYLRTRGDLVEAAVEDGQKGEVNEPV